MGKYLMKKNRLGLTGLEITELGLGTMTWGNQNTETDAHAQIDYALDAGLNFMDTAEMYAVPPSAETYGKTETYIGTWFKKTGKRDQWILASKIAGGGRREWIRGGRPSDASSIREAVEGSLTRLQTDFIDLYQVHWPSRKHYNFENGWRYDPSGQSRSEIIDHLSGMLETFDAMIKEGKIGHIGVSNETAWGLMTYLDLAKQNNWPRIASVQNEYSLLRRQFDLDLSEICMFEDIAMLGYSPLGAGAISGKYLDGGNPAGTRGDITGGLWRVTNYSEPAIRAYVNLARDHGLDPCQMAIAFAKSRPFMTSVLLGATSMEQLKSDIDAVNLVLDPAVVDGLEEINRRFPRPI